MNIKLKINQFLAVLGYSLVSNSTLARLMEEPLRRVTPDSAPSSERAPVSGFKLIPAPNRPPPICTALAPKYDPSKTPSQLAFQIVEFQEKGIAIIGTSAEKAAACREAETFDREFRNYHPTWDWAGPFDRPVSPDIKAGLPSERLKGDLRSLLSSPNFEEFFRAILGCPATVANCRLVRSMPHLGNGVGPQEWHRDGCPAGVLRGVLYLTDVDADAGPFQYKDEAGNEHTILGKAGDLLVFDAMRLLHRALPPSRKIRTAIDLVFMPRMPQDELQIIVAGLNHWPADPFFYSIPIEPAQQRKEMA